MQINYEAHSAKLELRIMELEDTTRAMTLILKTMGEMIGSMNEMMNHYADTLSAMMLQLPSVVHKLPLWPVAAKACKPNTPLSTEGNEGCAGYCCGANEDNTPTASP